MKNSRHRHAVALLLFAIMLAAASGCRTKPLSFEERRAEMVKHQLVQRGIADERILSAFRAIPREDYVLPTMRDHAYDDAETPIGEGQSIDRPYENAVMLEALALSPADRVLEVGTGSGYLASLMSHIAREVFTIDIDPVLARLATERLSRLGFRNITVRSGDGFLGWPDEAPFDAIVLTCSPPTIPAPLSQQLREGGRLVLPLGGTEKFQELVLYVKKDGRLVETRRIQPTEFVPMKGKIREK